MWERSFPPNNHRKHNYVVVYLPHCKFNQFAPPVYVACGSTKWALVYSSNSVDAIDWGSAVKRTQHSGAFEWWLSETPVNVCPRYVALPPFQVKKEQIVTEALEEIGLRPSRTLAKVSPWKEQPLFIRDFWCATVGEFLGLKTKYPVEFTSAMRAYINQYVPSQWVPKPQCVPFGKQIYPAATNGIFLRVVDLCLTFVLNETALWTAETKSIFNKLYVKCEKAARFRAPWIRPNREKFFERYLCETVCEQVWYDAPKPKISIPYQTHILPRLFNDCVASSPITKELQFTGKLNLSVCMLDSDTFNLGTIREDLFSVGVRRFKFPTTSRYYPHPIQQNRQIFYLSNPPYRKISNDLVDPNYIEIQGPISSNLQELRMDYPVLPLIPQHCYELLKCIHALIWDCEFMTTIPWCSVASPVVFNENNRYYMLTAYCLIES